MRRFVGALLRRSLDPREENGPTETVELIEAFLDRFDPGRLGATASVVDRRSRIISHIGDPRNELSDFPLCDSAFYLDRYPDIVAAGIAPLVHYLRFGGREGRDIHPIVSTNWYFEKYPDAREAGEFPVAHFILWGAEKGYDPHPLFDTGYYLERYPDAVASGLNPLVHYLKYPGRIPHPLFDTDYYSGDGSRSLSPGTIPLVHFLASGVGERRNPNPLFNTKYYLDAYPDVAAAGVNPLIHFVTAGAREGRRPCPEFDTEFYLRTYRDVASSGMNPLAHYLRYGASEGRHTRAAASSHRGETLDRPTSRDIFTPRRPSVVMIDVGYPQPDQDSGSIDQINFIRIFQSLRFDIYFIAVAQFRSMSPYREALVAMGVTCVHIPEYKSIEKFIEEKADVLDLFFLSRVHFGGRYMEYIKRICPYSKVIFNTVDLHYLREGREALLRLDIEALTQAQKTRSRELELVATADATIVVSLVEEKTLETAAERGNIHCIPLVRDFAFDRQVDFDSRSGIGFIGGFSHQPNVDAVEYFLSEVWKQIQLELPDVELFVIGSNMSEAWKARSVPGVNFIGYVRELDPWLDRLRLTVAPLRYGAGAKGKVVLSLGHGAPCVASPIAAEGMGLQDGVNITIAGFPHEFAAKVVRVYREPELWRHLSEAGLELVRAQNSFERGLDSMRDVLESLDLIKAQ